MQAGKGGVGVGGDRTSLSLAPVDPKPRINAYDDFVLAHLGTPIIIFLYFCICDFGVSWDQV